MWHPLAWSVESEFHKGYLNNVKKNALLMRDRGPLLYLIKYSFILRMWHPPAWSVECESLFATENWSQDIKALNRENQLECIRQSIRVRFDYRLRALVGTR